MKMMILRGLVLGGSLGIFANLLGFSDAMLRSALTGTIAGALAGFTAYKLAEKRKNRKNGK